MKAKTLVATLMGVLSFAAMAGELDNTPNFIARPAGVEAAPVGGVLVKRDENGKIIEAYKVPMKVTEENQAQALIEITSNPENNITAKLNQTAVTKSELDESSSAASSFYIGVGWGGGYGYGIGYGYGWGGYYGGYCGGYGYGYGYGCGGYGYGGYWGGYYPYYRPYGGCWGWYY